MNKNRKYAKTLVTAVLSVCAFATGFSVRGADFNQDVGAKSGNRSDVPNDWAFSKAAVICGGEYEVNQALLKTNEFKELVVFSKLVLGQSGSKTLHTKIRPPYRVSAPALGSDWKICVTVTSDAQD